MAPTISRHRVAVVLDQPVVEPWQRCIFNAIRSSNSFELDAVVIGVASARPDDRGWTLLRAVNRLERNLSTNLFRRVFGRKRKVGASRVPVASVCPDVDVTTLGAANDGAGSGIANSLTNVDLVIDLRVRGPEIEHYVGDTGLAQDTGEVWRLVTGRPLTGGGGDVPAGFGEVALNDPATEVDLIAVGPGGRSRVIERGTFRTFLWSWHENERQLRFKAALLVVDALNDLAAGRSPRGAVIASSVAGKSLKVGTLSIITTLLRCGWRIARELYDRGICEERWRVHVAHGNPVDVDLSRAKAIDPPSDCYWADPFPITRNGRNYVYFEEYPYKTRRGVISVTEYEERDQEIFAAPAERVLERNTHMSYPFLFEYDSSLYMIPETSADKRIELWRCTDFPVGWQKVRSLLTDVSATDTTLIEHEGRWWMFTNIDRSGLGDHCSELHVFYSSDPVRGSWTAHARNPVVRDAGAARMAGSVFLHEGALIRPAQVNAHYYGEALKLQKINRLDTENYEERTTRLIRPDWCAGIYRNHHISCAGDHVVIDACHNRLKLNRWMNGLGLRLGFHSPHAVKRLDHESEPENAAMPPTVR